MTALELQERLRDGDPTMTAIEMLIAIAYKDYPTTCAQAVKELETLRQETA